MITKNNLEKYLSFRGYIREAGQYRKKFKNVAAEIVVDMNSETITFPVIVHDNTTSNFYENENFVVLDCIDRLLEIGYQPDCIEIEPRWKLGHTGKSGKADVCVRDRAGDMYLIIECKTAGEEYDEFLAKLYQDGGQLFSYWQQETKTRWLCLFSADFNNNEANYEGASINGSGDLADYYKQAGSASDRFRLWQEAGSKLLSARSIFEPKSDPYCIGEKPFTIKDLKNFTDEDKGSFISKFAEILRHNSISDKENAFNKLVVLFICKLVDELEKGENEIADFQIKQSDTYELVQDRLQALYKQGMGSFLNEDIYYLELDYPNKFAAQYKGGSRNNLILDLQNTIRKLKFYTNSDFAFKDVHNDRLFQENGAILFEMVRLIQPYRIAYTSRHQILGDLFESLLDSGFKQDEGQFFTPMPITRFVWDCIPERLLGSGDYYPKFIDFASGAGHFLNEGVLVINEYHGDSAGNSWCADKVYGIEKDDRLARVSKVSLLMNGVLNSNIVNGDGLELHDSIREGDFDFVISNPPYSVASFKKYLSNSIKRRLKLSDFISDSGKQIESLFVERAAELLKPGGTCVLILPTSLLSNGDTASTETRKFILQRFVIHAIVNLEKNAFQATGTLTSIIYMTKRIEPPCPWKTAWDSVDTVFQNESNLDWEGYSEFDNYLDFMGYDRAQYEQVIKAKNKWWTLSDVVHTDAPVEIESSEKQEIKFHRQILQRERESFYYWLLTKDTAIAWIQSPKSTKEQQDFLGYKWKKSRENRGIVPMRQDSVLDGYAIRAPRGSIAAFIRESFDSDFKEKPIEMPKFSKRIPLSDCINFADGKYVIDGVERISVKWSCPTIRLGKLCPKMIIGATPSTNDPSLYNGKTPWITIADIKKALQSGESYVKSTKKMIRENAIANHRALQKDTLIMSFKLSIGLCAFTSHERVFTNEAIVALMPETGELDKKYLYCLLSSGAVPLIPPGTKKIGKSYNVKSLENIVIPYPNESIRSKIVSNYLDGLTWKSPSQSRKKDGEDIRLMLAGKEEAARVKALLAETPN